MLFRSKKFDEIQSIIKDNIFAVIQNYAILGAGRKTKDDAIDFAAGIVLKEKTGAKVEQGQTLAVLHTNRPETIADAERVFLEAIRWGTDAPEAQPLIYGIVK